MSKISSYKKTKIEEETSEEFYLNPKDMINNDKIFESSQTELMIYLPFNELLIVVFEENIAVVDIKRTVSSNFTIIKMINHIDIHKDCLVSQEEKKAKVPSKDLSFNSYCFKVKENDLRRIKNMIVIESKWNLNEVYFVIEYMNLDLVIVKYSNIYLDSKYRLVYSHDKHYFTNYSKKLKMNYESIMILNYQTKLYSVGDENDNDSSANSTYIIHQVERMLLVYCVDSDSYTLISTIHLKVSIKAIASAFCNNTLIQVIADANNAIQCDFYSSFKLIHSQSLAKENEGHVSLVKFDVYNKKKVLLYAQLHHVAIYSIDNKSAHLTQVSKISFGQFDDWVISYCFVLDDSLYIFNSNGDYSYNDLESKESSNHHIQSLNISRQIYSIANFKTNIGVFILSTQNTIRLNHVNITYFIPKNISQRMTLKMLIDMDSANKNSFYSYFLCEFLIFYIRFYMIKHRDGDKDGDGDRDSPLKEEDYANQPKSNLIEKRIEVYHNQINNKSKSSSNNYYRDIIAYYQKSNPVQIESCSYYLNNRLYKCDFCANLLINYHDGAYYCRENHQTFSCCVTNVPFESNFFQCVNCNLFYENKFKICLICQQMLSYAL